MGYSSTTLCFQNVTQEQVVEAIKTHFPSHRAYVSPAQHSWVCVYDAECDWGGPNRVIPTASAICKVCQSPCLAMEVHVSDYFYYWLFDSSGNLVDHSYPDDPQQPTQPEIHGIAGELRHIADLLDKEIPPHYVKEAIEEGRVFAEESLFALVDLFGIVHAGHSFIGLCEEFDPRLDATLKDQHGSSVIVQDLDKYVYVGGETDERRRELPQI